MTFSRTFLAFSAFLAAAVLLAPPAARAEKQWRTYTGCTLKESSGNDGDSFHVDCGSLKSAKARHKLIRLYFVDTPESEDSLPDRLEVQRKYWDLPDDKTVVKMGKMAHDFTDRVLKDGFTVHSRLSDARGRSKIDRDYGMVWVDSMREDLGYLLVRNGLARVFGMPTDLDDLDDYKKTKEAWNRRLHMAEADARRERKGCWAYSQSATGAGTSPFAARLPAPGAAPAPSGATAPRLAPPPATAAQPVIPPVARPPSAAPRQPLPPAAPSAAPSPAARPGSLSAATSARMDALNRPPSIRPQDVATTRVITIYDPSKLPSAVPLGQLRAGMTLHVQEAVNPSLVRVSFTTSSGRAISGIARIADLPPLAP